MAKYVINEKTDLATAAKEVQEIAARRNDAPAEPNTLDSAMAELVASRAKAAEPPPARLHPLVYVGLGVAVVAALAVLSLVLSRALIRTRPVPNVVGQKIAVAEKVVQRIGLRTEIEYVNGNGMPAGTVIALLPAQGTKVRSGTSVTLKVARRKGESSQNTPHLDSVPTKSSATAKNANTDQPPTTPKVTITVPDAPNTNPAPASKKVVIPPVAGMSARDATLALESVGLQVDTATARDASKPDGVVLAVDPKVGMEVAAGSPVRLKINDLSAKSKDDEPEKADPTPGAAAPAPRRDQPMVVVPDYTGLAGKDAATDMWGRNLKPEWVFEENNRLVAGTVIITNPPAGSRVPPGSKVMLVLSK